MSRTSVSMKERRERSRQMKKFWRIAKGQATKPGPKPKTEKEEQLNKILKLVNDENERLHKRVMVLHTSRDLEVRRLTDFCLEQIRELAEWKAESSVEAHECARKQLKKML